MNRKHAWTAFFIALCIALPVRIYQMLMLVDLNTGFFTDGNVTAVLISCVLVIGVIFILVSCRRDKSFAEYQPVQSWTVAVPGLLAGAAVAVQSVLSLAQAASSSQDVYDEAEISTGVQHPLLYACMGILGIAAAIVILITAVNFARGKNLFRNFPLVSLIPPLWGCLCLVVLFVKFTEVVNTTESVYDLFTSAFLLLFFSSQAKFLSAVDSHRSFQNVFGFGLSAALIGLVTSVPNCIAAVARQGLVQALTPFVSVTNFLLCLYVVAFLLELRRIKVSESPVFSQKTEDFSQDISQND